MKGPLNLQLLWRYIAYDLFFVFLVFPVGPYTLQAYIFL